MKFWLLISFIFLTSQIVNAKNFHVEVLTKMGTKIFSVTAPSDSIALDSVYIGAVYNKRFPHPIQARIQETNLSTEDFPLREFKVTTDKKSYFLSLNVADPDYAMTAIQASKFLMSKLPAREIVSTFNYTKLKNKNPTRYILQLKSQEISYLLNPDNIEEGRIALDLAAQLSNRAEEYVGIKIPNYTCKKMFAN